MGGLYPVGLDGKAMRLVHTPWARDLVGWTRQYGVKKTAQNAKDVKKYYILRKVLLEALRRSFDWNEVSVLS